MFVELKYIVDLKLQARSKIFFSLIKRYVCNR